MSPDRTHAEFFGWHRWLGFAGHRRERVRLAETFDAHRPRGRDGDGLTRRKLIANSVNQI
jgi:hypothetical protein